MSQPQKSREELAEELVALANHGSLYAIFRFSWPSFPRKRVGRIFWIAGASLLVLILVFVGVAGTVLSVRNGETGAAVAVAVVSAIAIAAYSFIFIEEMTEGPRLRKRALADPEWAIKEIERRRSQR